MHDLIARFRFTARQLRKSPGFSVTAILTLAIGIGATTAIFSLFYSVLLRPLPFPEPKNLVEARALYVSPGSGAHAAGVPNNVSYPDFFDWREKQHSFVALASYHSLNAAANPNGSARMISGVAVSSDFFRVLGITPALGRDFSDDEEKPGNRSVVISHELWRSEFGGSTSILGQQIRLFEEPYTVIGVMPARFLFPVETPAPAFWITSARDAEGKDPSTGQRGFDQLAVVGRLKHGVSIAQAQADLTGIQAALARQYPDEDRTLAAVRVTQELASITGDIRPALRVLFGAVMALLLIACANVAGLLLARGGSRQSELAVRAALGASRGEIAWQLLTESVLLALVGGTAGTVLAFVLLKELLRFVPATLPRVAEAGIDLPVLAFSLAVSVATGIVFGLLPARRLAKVDPALALRDGTRNATTGRKHHRLHSALVVTETALGLMLLIGAGLLVRSFIKTVSAEPGFNPEHLLTFRVGVPPKRYADEAVSMSFYRAILAKLRAMPGVKSVTAVNPLPLSGSSFGVTFAVEGHSYAPGEEPEARVSLVEPNYFQTMEIPILRGRAFSDAEDVANGRPVMIINQEFARRFFSGENPIGKRIQPGLSDDSDQKPYREIVAVTADVKRSNLTEGAQPEFYIPYGEMNFTSPYFVVRVASNPLGYVAMARSAVASLDKDAPLYRINSYDELLENVTSQSRLQAVLLSSFAVIALLLAAIGLYAVLSYMVTQRTHEIGLRIALGAQRNNVLHLVLREGVFLAFAGLLIGASASIILTRFLSTLLYHVKPFDPLTFAVVALVLLSVSVLASVIPAARASKLDPIETLREQ